VALKVSHQILEEQLFNAFYYYDLPGIVAGVGSGQHGLEFVKSFGKKNVVTGEPLTPKDIFHMASMAKLFTGTGIMQLWEKGLLDLDVPITRYLEWFQMGEPSAKHITIRQLLTHTSGMPDVSDYHWDQPQTSSTALMEYIQSDEIRSARLLWPASDKKFSYSNIGYDILGLIISVVSKQTFEAYMEANIFKPLGMTESTFFTPDRDMASICSPHEKNAAKEAVPLKHYPYNRIHAPSSTLTSNIFDTAMWAIAHLNKRVLLPETYHMVWEAFATVPNNGENICLSWFSREQNGFRLYGHEGADVGFRSSFWICPELDFFVILCSNLSSAPLKTIGKSIFELLSLEEEPYRRQDFGCEIHLKNNE
jgi:CubicO group peptidase (beta-lactamase class C family)